MLVRQNFIVVFPDIPMPFPSLLIVRFPDGLRACRNTRRIDDSPLPHRLVGQSFEELHARRVSPQNLAVLLLQRHKRCREG